MSPAVAGDADPPWVRVGNDDLILSSRIRPYGVRGYGTYFLITPSPPDCLSTLSTLDFSVSLSVHHNRYFALSMPL